MNIDFAVERLYDVGWSAAFNTDVEVLPDGRKVPTIAAVQTEFARAGLELTITHKLMFGCYRATWASNEGDRGTVIGDSEIEAAVYALAQLRRSQKARELNVAVV